MNVCTVSGKIVRGPFVVGNGKVFKFTIATKYRFSADSTKEGLSYVPCTIFEPSDELKQLLSSDEPLHCQGIGRVSRSSYENKEGEKVFSTEVILHPGSVKVHKE
jgi:single-stranded DNA-binding protein